MDEPSERNRAAWDERAPAHAASPDYACARFAADPAFLSGVVRYDLPRLGDLRGLSGVHLQCHIGTDTVSLARLGAAMTGLDFSAAALAEARRLAAVAAPETEFVLAELYAAAEVLGRERFDLVYTGIGALCWLPDVRRWAEVVAALLRPGGRLFLREGHPILWALDASEGDGRLALEHPYFEHAEPTRWVGNGTYVATDRELPTALMYEWNHGLGEIVAAVLAAGLELTWLEEHDSVPWNALPGRMEQIGGGEWRLLDRPGRLPASYTLQARRPAR